MEESNCGIYKIVNLVNGKLYVGSTVNFKRRKGQHFYDLKSGKHDNDYLQKSYNKHGKNNFKFEILEAVCDRSILLEREQYWIDKLNVCNRDIGFNISEIAGNTLGRIVSIKTREMQSISMKKYYEKNSNPMLGIKHSQESIQKMRDNKKNKVMVINIETGEIFDGASDAGRKYGISKHAIRCACSGKSKKCLGMQWMYLEDYNSTIK